jgi:hypothetical protein
MNVEHPSLERIFPATYRSPDDDLERLGVGVALMRRDSGGLHVGIVFRSSKGPVQLLHLVWQDRLRCDPLPTSSFWGPCFLHPIRQRAIALLCERVASNMCEGPVDWGWSYDGGQNPPITADGVPTEDRRAMTCATFVLALFAAQGASLVDPRTWPEREEDRQWAAAMLKMFDATASEHCERLAKDIPTLTRIRPCEVAVAVTGVDDEDPPFEFQHVHPHSERLFATLCGEDGRVRREDDLDPRLR